MLSRTHLAILLLVVVASTGFAGTYTEDFTTTTFKDAANTTADWNTGDGELKLFCETYEIVNLLGAVVKVFGGTLTTTEANGDWLSSVNSELPKKLADVVEQG